MISLIVAYNNNKVIGKDGKIPWFCPEDLKRFKELTMGSPVIMGRKTWESLPVRPLPGRGNVVVSKTLPLQYSDSIIIVSTLRAAILGSQEYYPDSEIFIIGGEEIYRQAMPLADRMYLTHINNNSEGDAFFPDFLKVYLGNYQNDLQSSDFDTQQFEQCLHAFV